MTESESSQDEMGSDVELNAAIHSENNILTARDGTTWRFGRVAEIMRGRLPQHNVLWTISGPTTYSTHRVNESPLSELRVYVL